MTPTRQKPSVIIIREMDSQMTGSGCCGKLIGDTTRYGGRVVFRESRRLMQQCGELSEALRQELGDAVDITLVDPRNQLYLWPRLVRDVWRFRTPLTAALRTLAMAFSLPAVIVNGRVVASRHLPELPELIRAIRV
jgi:hypothetical protein